jgi:hypothetical protein
MRNINAVFDALFKESEERKRRKADIAAQAESIPRVTVTVTQAQSMVSPVCLERGIFACIRATYIVTACEYGYDTQAQSMVG